MVQPSRSRAARALAAALLLLGAATGCTTKRAPVAQPPTVSCPEEPPREVFVALTTWRGSAAKTTAALRAVQQQLRAVATQPGAPGLQLSVYALTGDAFNAQPVRQVRAPCIPPMPDKPNLESVGTFGREAAQNAYQKGADQVRRQQVKAAQTMDELGKQLTQVHWPADPPSVWGMLSLASREFSSVEGAQRTVILVTPGESDEEREWKKKIYCAGCTGLRGATVVFLNFDHDTPADRRFHSWAFSCWLAEEGASKVLFYGSNQSIPALFGRDQPSPPFRSEELLGKGCRR